MKRPALILLTLAGLSLACGLFPGRSTPPPAVVETAETPPETNPAPTHTPQTGPTPTPEVIIESFLPVPEEGLVLHFPFNGNLEETVQGLTATTTNTTSAVGRFGYSDGAIAFNGVDSLILLPDADFLDLTGSFTIAFFIQGRADSDHEWLILTKHEAGGCQPENTSWMIRYQADMGLRFVNYDTSADCGRIILAAPEVNLLDDQWHHVAWVHDAAENTLRLYVDGVQAAEAHNIQLNIQNNSLPLVIGNQYQGGPQHAFDGALDDLYIYHTALRVDQISLLTAAGR